MPTDSTKAINGLPALSQFPRMATRPAPAFLAQLIAAAQKLPQMRTVRRAEPCEAVHAYRMALARSAGWNAHTQRD